MADGRVYGTGQNARSSKTVNEVSHIAGNLTKSLKKLSWAKVDLDIANQHVARLVKVNDYVSKCTGVFMKAKCDGLVAGGMTVEEANRQVFLEALQPHVQEDGAAPVEALVGLVQPLALMMEVTLIVAEHRIQSWEAARILEAQQAALEARRVTLAQEIRDGMAYELDE
jgi:hypothetical protein